MSAATTTNQPDDGAARGPYISPGVDKGPGRSWTGRGGYSIPAQREACRRRAETLDADVADEFVDRGESARSSDRPELQRMLTHVSDHSIDYLIVHKVDRLARNRSDDVTIHMALQAAGVRLVSCSENIDETPSGMLLHGIMGSIAEFYSRNLASEVIKGSVQKAKAGGTISKAPCGYVNVGRWSTAGKSERSTSTRSVGR
ncbi:MAG: recombinase family protein [Candidatus Microthrix sp.]|nr:recombinase family protein [Candidatus Microthrix sp.]MBK6439185.1 recombinase family protein [Candidatus Microthrix sp.]